MMVTAFEYEDGRLVDGYELGVAECPAFGYPAAAHFKNGVLVETKPYIACRDRQA